VGADNFKRQYPEGKNGRGSIRYVENIDEALKEANVCFIFTEWSEIKAVKPETYKQLMRTPLVYDGRNIYSVEEMSGAGCRVLLYRSKIGQAFTSERIK